MTAADVLFTCAGALLIAAVAVLYRVTRHIADPRWIWLGLILLSACIGCAATALALRDLASIGTMPRGW